MNLPNRLTLSRLAMAFLFVLFMSIDHVLAYVAAYIVFTAATITDYLDGKIARERQIITEFGKLVDPLADKILMAGAFIMLMKVPELWIPGWTIVAILAREFLVTGARSLAAAEGAVIAASAWGKAKTIIQMVYVFVFLFFVILFRLIETSIPGYSAEFAQYLAVTSYGAIVLVAIFTVYSGVEFAKSNWRALNLSNI